MCGRYTMTHAEAAMAALRERLGLEVAKDTAFPTRYNVAPTQIMPVVKGGKSISLAALQWGHFVQFTPESKPTLLINGRSEEAVQKRTFKKPVQEHRCIVPADGFFEWLRTQGGKVRVPYYFRMKDHRTFWIAGLYWPTTEEAPSSYILLTTGPNALMAPIHDRMPVILDDDNARKWLTDGPITPDQMKELCISYPADRMTASRVDPYVNSARNDDPKCISHGLNSSLDEEFKLE